MQKGLLSRFLRLGNYARLLPLIFRKGSREGLMLLKSLTSSGKKAIIAYTDISLNDINVIQVTDQCPRKQVKALMQ
jgi:hypothetical protein